MSKRCKVIVVAPYAEGETYRGISAVTSALLRSQMLEKYSVAYVATTHRGNILYKIAMWVSGVTRYIWLLLTSGAGIVHIHSASYSSFFRKTVYALLGLAWNKKVIMHVHGGKFKDFYSEQRPEVQRGVSWLLNHMAVVIVLSKSWQTFFESVANKADIRILPNPVDGSAYSLMQNHVARKGNTVVFLGKLDEAKGAYDLLDAVPAVLRNHPNAQFLLCGDGDVEQSRNLAFRRGVGTHVEFPGYVWAQDKLEILARSDVFVLPSHMEGVPIALLEAMFAGLPVVTTPVGGIPDFFQDGINGFFVPVGDSRVLADRISFLLAHEEQRRSFGEKNRELARSVFDVNVVALQLSAIYDEILAHHS